MNEISTGTFNQKKTTYVAKLPKMLFDPSGQDHSRLEVEQEGEHQIFSLLCEAGVGLLFAKPAWQVEVVRPLVHLEEAHQQVVVH